MKGSKRLQQKHWVKPVAKQDNWWHSSRSARLHTLHPDRCKVWILACHTGQRKQPNDNIQQPMGQIQMAMTTVWTQSGRRCLLREMAEYSEAFQMSTTLQMMCWLMEKLKFPVTKVSSVETARANNITFNSDKFVFKSNDLKFFGNLTWEGYKVDPKEVHTITEMKPPQNLQDLQSYLGLVNYLNCFSPKLA